jgi:adenylate cyclase
MGRLSFYSELRRRNVFKVGIVYFAVAWLLLQVSDTLGPALRLPEWFVSAVAFLLILGFPVAIIFAWAFELTPDGLKAETKTESTGTTTDGTGGKLNYVVAAAVVFAVGYFVLEKVVLDAPETPTDVQATGEQPTTDEPAAIDRSIAVLPFVNMSSDEEQEYFSDGLSEELLNLLARIPDLNVAARTSSFSFKGKDLAIPEIASQLNVAHILEGSVRKHGNQIRVTAQLIQADNGYHLWSETYDRQMDNVFQIQEDIAKSVVDALRITLLGDVPSIRRTDPEAYQLFLEGQYLKRQISDDSLNRAVEAFRKAVEVDPAYAPAWAELADTYIWGGFSDRLSYAKRTFLAEEAIEKAIATDPDYAFAYYVRGIYWIFGKNRFDKGIEDFEHAFELDPDDAFLVAAIGKGAVLTGNFDLAISQYLEALAMEPVVPEFYYFLGRAYLASGRLDEAERVFRKLVALSPSTWPKDYLMETLFMKSEYEAALQVSDAAVSRALNHFALGNIAEADKALEEITENGDAYNVAIVYGHRGETAKALEWLNKSIEDSEYFPWFILTEPAFQGAYSDERWRRIMEELGLLEYWQDMTPT